MKLLITRTLEYICAIVGFYLLITDCWWGFSLAVFAAAALSSGYTKTWKGWL